MSTLHWRIVILRAVISAVIEWVVYEALCRLLWDPRDGED